MPAVGLDVFVQLPDEKPGRVLHPTKVVELDGDRFTAELEDDTCAPEAGQEILIYYNQGREFVKQSARIEAVIETEENEDGETKTALIIEPAGQPVAAEDRQYYRISTVLSSLTISFGDSDDCQLVDVSPQGFAVISSEQFSIGTIVTATPRFDDLEETGRVCVQSIRKLGKDRYRCGVHCVDKSLQEKVQQISMAIQQQQLRRLAGRA